MAQGNCNLTSVSELVTFRAGEIYELHAWLTLNTFFITRCAKCVFGAFKLGLNLNITYMMAHRATTLILKSSLPHDEIGQKFQAVKHIIHLNHSR